MNMRTRLMVAMAALGAVAATTTDAAAPAARGEDPAEEAAALEPVEPFDYPLPAVLSEAGRARLRAERAVMARELENHLAHDPQDVARAVEKLEAGAADTVQDNLRRFAEAFAALNPQFASALEHYREGRFPEAAAALEPLMAENPGLKQQYRHDTLSPYCYEITKFFYAECLGRLGNLSDTIISYQVVYRKLPANFTFGAAARMRAALIYEQTARSHYAIPLYKGLVERYGDLLTDQEVLRLTLKTAAMIRSDPFRRASRLSAEVGERLDRGETGRAVQEAQKDLLARLQEMLVIEEEEQRPFLENTQVVAFGADAGELKEGAPPADFSLLPVPDPNMTGSDDWGRLRPREKQRLLQMFYETYPQRYREMLEAYYRNVSEAEARPSGEGP